MACKINKKIFASITGIVLVIFLVEFAYAEQTVKTIEAPIGFFSTTNPNQHYGSGVTSSPVVFDPPDGVAKVISAEIIIRGDFLALTDVQAFVNGINCKPNTWSVGSGNVVNYEMTFDCSDIITSSGVYNLTFMTSKQANNIYARYRITYYNNPRGEIRFHGTEYSPGEQAKAWIQLIDSNGNEVTQGLCFFFALYPDNTYFLYNAPMSYSDKGIYYYDFKVPYVSGTYPLIAQCYYNGSVNPLYANDSLIEVGSLFSGTYLDTWSDDDVYYDIKEENFGSQKRLKVYFNFTGIVQPNESIMTSFTIYWKGMWDSVTNDVITISIYNWSSGTWYDLPNVITPQESVEFAVGNSITTNNLTKEGLISNDGNVTLKFEDSTIPDTSSSNFRTDYLYISFDTFSTLEWIEVRGSSELHVTPPDGAYIVEKTNVYANLNDTSLYGGSVWVNFTVYSQSSGNVSTTFKFNGFKEIFCEDILEFKHWNGSAWIDVDNYTCEFNYETNNFVLIVPIELQKFGYDNYYIRFTNHLYEWANARYYNVEHIHEFMDALCDVYYNLTGIEPPQMPLNETYMKINDTFATQCFHLTSQYWHVNETYTKMMAINLSYGSNYTQYQLFEEEYMHLKSNYKEYMLHVIPMLASLDISALYSEQAINNKVAKNLSQISVTRLLVNMLNNLNNLSLSEIVSLNLATQDNVTTILAHIDNLNNLSLQEIINLQLATQDNVSTIITKIEGLNNLSLQEIIDLNLATQDNVTTIIAKIEGLNNLSINDIIALELATQNNISTILLNIDNLNNLSLDEIKSLNLATQSNVSDVLVAVQNLNNLSLQQIIDLNLATQENVTTIIAEIEGLNNLSLQEIIGLNLSTQDNVTSILNAIANLNNLSINQIIELNLATQDNVSTILTYIDNLNNLSLQEIIDLHLATQNNVSTIITKIEGLNNLSLQDIIGLNLSTQDNITTIITKIEGLNNLSINDIIALQLATQDNISTILLNIDNLNNLSLDDIKSLNLATQDNVSDVLIAVQNLNNLSLQQIIDLNLATQDNVTTIIAEIQGLNNLSLQDIINLNLSTQNNVTSILDAIANLNNLSIDQIIALNLATQDNVTTIIAKIDGLNNLSINDIIALNLATQTNVSDILVAIDNLNNLSLQDIISLQLATQDNVTTIIAKIDGLNNLSLQEIIDLNLATQNNVSDILNAISNLNNLSIDEIIALNLATQDNISIVITKIDNLNNLSIDDILSLNLATQNNVSTILTYIENLNNLSINEIIALNLATQDNITTILTHIDNLNNLSINDIIALNLATQSNVSDILVAIDNLNNLSLQDIISLQLATQNNVSTIIAKIENLNNLSLQDIIDLNLATQSNVTSILNAIVNLNNLSIDEIIALNLSTQDNITTIRADIVNLNASIITEIQSHNSSIWNKLYSIQQDIANLNNLSLADILTLNLSTQDNISLVITKIDNLNNLSIDDILSLNLATQDNVSTILTYIGNLNNLSINDIIALNLATQDNVSTILTYIDGLNNLSLNDIKSLELATQDNVTTILAYIDNLNNLSINDIIALNLATQNNVSTILTSIANLNNLSLQEIIDLDLATQDNISTLIVAIDSLNNLSIDDIKSLNLSTQDNITLVVTMINGLNNLSVQDILNLELATQTNVTTIINTIQNLSIETNTTTILSYLDYINTTTKDTNVITHYYFDLSIYHDDFKIFTDSAFSANAVGQTFEVGDKIYFEAVGDNSMLPENYNIDIHIYLFNENGTGREATLYGYTFVYNESGDWTGKIRGAFFIPDLPAGEYRIALEAEDSLERVIIRGINGTITVSGADTDLIYLEYLYNHVYLTFKVTYILNYTGHVKFKYKLIKYHSTEYVYGSTVTEFEVTFDDYVNGTTRNVYYLPTLNEAGVYKVLRTMYIYENGQWIPQGIIDKYIGTVQFDTTYTQAGGSATGVYDNIIEVLNKTMPMFYFPQDIYVNITIINKGGLKEDVIIEYWIEDLAGNKLTPVKREQFLAKPLSEIEITRTLTFTPKVAGKYMVKLKTYTVRGILYAQDYFIVVKRVYQIPETPSDINELTKAGLVVAIILIIVYSIFKRRKKIPTEIALTEEEL